MSPNSNCFTQALLNWYDFHGRKTLPWKSPVCPYRIWVSEIMLQQTQVATVIDYYERFMHAFPTISALANASQDSVLALWAGLGYYSRARNLHQTAKIIQFEYAGAFPSDYKTLVTLPGIGPSTAAAVVAQAFNKRATILDGNVKRVLARYFCVNGPIDDKTTVKALWEHAERLTPHQRVADYTQAIMDLGALICTSKTPQCTICPVNQFCQALQTGRQACFPMPKKKKARPTRKSLFIGLRYQDHILLHKRPTQGIWGGLFCLPQFNNQAEVHLWDKNQQLQLPNLPFDKQGPFRHSFTHYHLDYYIFFFDLQHKPSMSKTNQMTWVAHDKLHTIGLPAPIKKALLLA